MTERELVDETIEYYKTHPRAVKTSYTDMFDEVHNTVHCVYYDEETGNMCAVGRCMIDAKGHSHNQESVLSFFKGTSNFLDKELKPKYHGIRKVFWEKLQEFHDECTNWKTNFLHGNDLTTLGELKRDELYQLP